jgi:RsiW-degrading membrane proteinase PrsW (M82 family)
VAGRAARAALLAALVGLTAYSTFIVGSYNFYPAQQTRQVVAALAMLATVPGWLILALAARARGAPWPWLAFAVAWGAFAAVWLALTAFALVDPVEFGRPTVGLEPRVSSIVVAPLIEEPAKLLGAWIALAAVRRHGATLSASLGAAIGGLVGIAFGIA